LVLLFVRLASIGITHEELIHGQRIAAFSNHWSSCASGGATVPDQPGVRTEGGTGDRHAK
jgi:hypothetical protein